MFIFLRTIFSMICIGIVGCKFTIMILYNSKNGLLQIATEYIDLKFWQSLAPKKTLEI